MKKYISKSIENTYKIAGDIAKNLKGGEVLALVGDLGSGKTAFVKGLAKALGIGKHITSPTFVIEKRYDIKYLKNKKLKKLIHIDAYRLNTGKDLINIGINDDFLNNNEIVVVEWADKVKDIIPQNAIWIEFEVLEENQRKIIYR